MGASIHTTPPRIGDSLSFCSKSRAHCRESFQSYTMKPLSNTEGITMSNLENALQELREERSRTQLKVETLDQAISVIESLNRTGVSRRSSRPTRIVSAVSRRRMAQAQRARWAKARGRAPKPNRTISAAGRKRIAAAQRARWAKVKAGKKK